MEENISFEMQFPDKHSITNIVEYRSLIPVEQEGRCFVLFQNSST